MRYVLAMLMPILIVADEPAGAAVGAHPPWWGVPVIAGAFLLLGGACTFLYTLLQENRKRKLDQIAKNEDDLIDCGAELLEAGRKVRDLGMLRFNRTTGQYAEMAKECAPQLLDNLQLAAGRFSLVMPSEFEETYQEYFIWSSMLLIPPFGEPGMELAVNKQSQASRALKNQIRKDRGLGGLPENSEAKAFSSETAKQRVDALRDGLIAEMEEERAERRKR